MDRVLLPSSVSPSHYSLTLKPDLERLVFECNESISVVVRSATSSISLHSSEISISSVSFKTGSSVFAALEIKYNLTLSTVTFVFDQTLPLGPGELIISYRGILNGDMAGFYKSSYADADGNKKIMGSTQFESLDARRAFPCWDEPSVKATFSVSFIIPENLTALSNMPELCVVHLGSNLKKVSFHTTPKMSTYLVAWAVGEFDFVHGTTKSGVSFRVYSPPGRAEQGRFALNAGIRCLELYEEFFKVPYPLPKMDMLCVTEFAMGAMENWGLVTYRETALMIDEAKASAQAKQRVALIVAHELAHQWFGNLVTMAWWDGLWLNEGFAKFTEHLALGELFPEYKIWEQYTTESFGMAQRLDSLLSSHPIIVPIKHAEEVEQVFDAISYHKGSTVVRMVSHILGKEKFQEGLQLYMKRHAYGNTETVDLWNAWSEVSGKNIAELMHHWTKSTGYPYLKVLSEKWTDKDVTITLEQNRFLSDGSVVADSPVWQIPLFFATCGCESQEVTIMTERVQTFVLPVQAGGASKPWVKINAGQKALVRVAHSDEMIARMLGDIEQLSSIDRAALLLDSYALAKAGLGSLESVVSVLRALRNEENFVVWNAMAGVLEGLSTLLEQMPNQDVYGHFRSFGKSLVVKILEKVGWDSRCTDAHTDKLLRATVFDLLDTFAWDDAGVVAESKRRFDAHFADPSVLPADYKTTVYKVVLMNGGVAEYEKVLRTFTDTQDNQERKYATFSLGAARDMALKKRTLDWAVKSGDVKLQDFFYPIGSVAGSAAGSALAWTYFQENFPLIKSMLSKASPSLMDAVIVNSIGRFCTLQRADEVAAFFKANPVPSSQRRIDQSLENIRASGKMLAKIEKSALATVEFWRSQA